MGRGMGRGGCFLFLSVFSFLWASRFPPVLRFCLFVFCFFWGVGFFFCFVGTPFSSDFAPGNGVSQYSKYKMNATSALSK